jgi:hypothetical protein
LLLCFPLENQILSLENYANWIEHEKVSLNDDFGCSNCLKSLALEVKSTPYRLMIDLNLLFEVSCLMEPCLAVIKIHAKKSFVYTKVRYFFTRVLHHCRIPCIPLTTPLAFKRFTMRDISDFFYELIKCM